METWLGCFEENFQLEERVSWQLASTEIVCLKRVDFRVWELVGYIGSHQRRDREVISQGSGSHEAKHPHLRSWSAQQIISVPNVLPEASWETETKIELETWEAMDATVLIIIGSHWHFQGQWEEMGGFEPKFLAHYTESVSSAGLLKGGGVTEAMSPETKRRQRNTMVCPFLWSQSHLSTFQWSISTRHQTLTDYADNRLQLPWISVHRRRLENVTKAKLSRTTTVARWNLCLYLSCGARYRREREAQIGNRRSQLFSSSSLSPQPLSPHEHKHTEFLQPTRRDPHLCNISLARIIQMHLHLTMAVWPSADSLPHRLVLFTRVLISNNSIFLNGRDGRIRSWVYSNANLAVSSILTNLFKLFNPSKTKWLLC